MFMMRFIYCSRTQINFTLKASVSERTEKVGAFGEHHKPARVFFFFNFSLIQGRNTSRIELKYVQMIETSVYLYFAKRYTSPFQVDHF